MFKNSILISAMTLSLMPLLSHAQSNVSTNTKASATLASMCSLSATNINFGTYNAASSDVFVTGGITVQCSKGTTATLGINVGTGDGGGYSGAYSSPYYSNTYARYMSSTTGDMLFYNLFQDSSYQTVFGGFNWFAANKKPTISGTGSPQTIPVYAVLPKGQYITPALYSDTITAEIDY
jgi:spore coat protein U-like protein